MDSKLSQKLRNIDSQIQLLYAAEEKYLTIEAAKEHFLAVLMKDASGSSVASKELEAKSTIAWRDFKASLALSEALFHKERHVLELRLKAYDGEHLTLKVEAGAIRRQVD